MLEQYKELLSANFPKVEYKDQEVIINDFIKIDYDDYKKQFFIGHLRFETNYKYSIDYRQQPNNIFKLNIGAIKKWISFFKDQEKIILERDLEKQKTVEEFKQKFASLGEFKPNKFGSHLILDISNDFFNGYAQIDEFGNTNFQISKKYLSNEQNLELFIKTNN